MTRTKQTARKSTGGQAPKRQPTEQSARKIQKEKAKKLNMLPLEIKTSVIKNENLVKEKSAVTLSEVEVVTETDDISSNCTSGEAASLVSLPNSRIKNQHPIPALIEFCNKNKWARPDFVMIKSSGTYLMKVTVNNVDYQPDAESTNKKQAKAKAAMTCLKALGILV